MLTSRTLDAIMLMVPLACAGWPIGKIVGGVVDWLHQPAYGRGRCVLEIISGVVMATVLIYVALPFMRVDAIAVMGGVVIYIGVCAVTARGFLRGLGRERMDHLETSGALHELRV